MKKTIKIITVVFFLFGLTIGGIIAYRKYMEYLEEERIRNAIVKIDYINPLEIEFNSIVKLSDLIKSINGTLIDDYTIDTTVVGKKELSFEYINEENIKVPIKFIINILDKTPPLIWLNDTYKVTVGTTKRLEDVIMCADNYDDSPKCMIIGEYDLNKIGEYELKYEAIDQSGNKTIKEFTLKVAKKSTSTSKTTTIPFQSLYNEYKKENTMIGIDVSKWQGDIDYLKVKEAGVEFVFIKVGGQNGLDKEYYMDPKFQRNIEGFKSVDIPVGLYFYSYANTVDKAYQDAMWVINVIKNYKIDLPIAFDWENWSSYNQFHMSFYTLTKVASKFMSTLKEHGYDSMLYSSKNYLDKIWMETSFPTWLAHYTSNTDYEGSFKCWQRTSSAKISGITANTVDFNICYK